MNPFFEVYGVVGFWIVSLLSFGVAYIIRRTKLLRLESSGEKWMRISTILAIGVAAFALTDHLILRTLLRLYFIGQFTDWILYLLLVLALDIALISPHYPKHEKAISTARANHSGFAKLSSWYLIGRMCYSGSIILRLVVGGFAYSNSLALPREDIERGSELWVTSKVLLKSAMPNGYYGQPALEIYTRELGIFKKKQYTAFDKTMGGHCTI